ncbi:MAG: hypothetical protein HC778_07175 [Chamaesiphon sp. CSU_1_12]|nr:hypothetical protein [Chamaesiphon sp. CSU_1_12]
MSLAVMRKQPLAWEVANCSNNLMGFSVLSVSATLLEPWFMAQTHSLVDLINKCTARSTIDVFVGTASAGERIDS